MLSKPTAKMLSEQINKELFSAYLYLSIANYYGSVNLNGFESWFSVQAREEMDHALLIRTFLSQNDETVALTAIDGPDRVYDSFLAPVEAAYAHEQFITASINDIYAAAIAEKEFRTVQFLDWFVKEQIEEEKNVSDIIQRYKLFATDGRGLYLLDQELLARVYTAPSLVL